MKELQVVLNGNEEILENTMNLSEFLSFKGLNPETIIVELNGKIIKKTEWNQTILQDKDCLEVLKFVGGG